MSSNDRLHIIITEERRKKLNRLRTLFSENTASRTIEKSMELSLNYFENKDYIAPNIQRKINPNKNVVKGIGDKPKKEASE